jgi:hypothetical protein
METGPAPHSDPPGATAPVLPYASLPGEHVPVGLLQDVHLLEQASAFFTIRRAVVQAGIQDCAAGFAILFSMLVPMALMKLLGGGPGLMHPNAVWLSIILVGQILAGAGVWNVADPSRWGIAISGVTAIGVASSMIVVPVRFIHRNDFRADNVVGMLLFVALLVLLFAYGSWRIVLMRRFAKAARPSHELFRWLDLTCKSIWRGRCDRESNRIEFTLSSGRWRGRLLGELAIFVSDKRRFLFLTRDQADITHTTGRRLGGKLKARFTLGSVNGNGAVASLSLDRFRQWKAVAATALPPA